MKVPENLRYTREHEWARIKGGRVTIGITDYAQEELGEIFNVKLPEEGDEVAKDDVFGSIESAKTISDLYSPVSGEVIKVNDVLEERPELVNEDPYGEGWMIRVEITDSSELDFLLTAEEYETFLEEEGELPTP